jgi:hypothetical protein
MRTVKATAIVLLVALYTLALGGPRAIAPLWAQTTNPLIAPVPPPAAPSQLPAPVTTAIAPILAPVPTLALATPTPLLRVYFAARQGAVGACLTYNRIREPLTPTQTARSATTTVPILPGASVPGAAAQLTSTLPGTLKPSTATDLQNCSNCVCD